MTWGKTAFITLSCVINLNLKNMKIIPMAVFILFSSIITPTFKTKES